MTPHFQRLMMRIEPERIVACTAEHEEKVSDAVIRLEKWLTGEPDFLLQQDVRLILDTLREADDIRYEMLRLEQKHAKLRGDVETLLVRLGQVES
jgi:phosphopantetheine adenylyltransferase